MRCSRAAWKVDHTLADSLCFSFKRRVAHEQFWRENSFKLSTYNYRLGFLILELEQVDHEIPNHFFELNRDLGGNDDVVSTSHQLRSSENGDSYFFQIIFIAVHPGHQL